MDDDMILLDVDDDDNDSCLLVLGQSQFQPTSSAKVAALRDSVHEPSSSLPFREANFRQSPKSDYVELNEIPTISSMFDKIDVSDLTCQPISVDSSPPQLHKTTDRSSHRDTDPVVLRGSKCPGYQEMKKAEDNISSLKNNQSTRRGLSTGTLGPISRGGLQVNPKKRPNNFFAVDATTVQPTKTLSKTVIGSRRGNSEETCQTGSPVNCQPTAEVIQSGDDIDGHLTSAKENLLVSHIANASSSGANTSELSDNGMGNLLPNKPSSPHMVKSNTKFRKHKNMLHDVEVDDLDYLEESNSGLLISPDPSHVWLTMPQGSPITSEIAIELKTLVLGTYRKSFPDEWALQDFSLSKRPVLKYGIVQKKGGPCGVLACVGAHLIKEVFFNRSWRSSMKSEIPEDEAKKCLALALANILWRCGGNKSAIIALPSNRQVFTDVLPGLCDGLIEKLTLMHFNDLAALQSFLNRHICWYTENNKFACIAFLYSAILSRGITNIKMDMDDPKTCLVGTHDYCSQEVVNLLLTGCASSNVFDDVITLDDGNESRSVLKGITKCSDIGFLALYEHYNSCQVGSYFKHPRYPVWVICSESHFSILFGKDSFTCEKNSNKPNDTSKFDLYYFDGLLNPDKEIKLSIDLLASSDVEDFNKNHVPPLEHCIRTKWKGATVDWNGTEPIL